MIDLPLDVFHLDPRQPYQMHDLLTDAKYVWRGPRNYVELNPQRLPAHIFCVRRRVRTENGVDYFAITGSEGGRETLCRMSQDQLWYKDAIIYQVHVRTFFDTNGGRHRRFPRPGAEARLSAGIGHQCHLAHAVLSFAPAR